MSDEWRWVGPDGFEYTGSLERLGAALASGELPPTVPVWHPALPDWLPAQQVPELAARMPELRTPPPVGVSADAVVVATPGGAVHSLTPPERPVRAAKPELAPVRERRPRALLALLAAGGVIALGGVWVLATRAPDEPAPPRAVPVPAPAASASASPPPPLRCAVNRTRRLAPKVLAKVPIVLRAAPPADALLVGFSESRTVARTLTLDAETLDVRASTPKAPGPFELRIAKGRLMPWSETVGRAATLPRVDGSAELGYLVTLRRGGVSGDVLAGWLSRDGAKRSELAVVASDAAQLGTPAAAVGAGGALLAVAARPGPDAPWDVQLARAELGKIPERFQALNAIGSERPQRMSPAAAALSDGGWVLQWTERARSGHEVRVALLGRDLAPRAPALGVSPQGASSGQGEVWARDDRIVSVFLVATGKRHELWASTIRCR